MRKTKRHAQRLIRICLLMIAIRIVDVYWVVKPAFYGGGFTLYWVDFVAPLAIGGLWLALFFWQLNSRSLVPIRDPRLQGAPRETVAF
jgi:fatty acid desaturase